MRRALFFVGLLLLLAWIAQIELPGYTQFELTDLDTGRVIFATVLSDGESVVLTWHNSIFDLDVTEEFTATHGALIQHAVTFADPRGLPPMIARPEDLDDLYHTGGPFVVRGITKRFTRITYLIGEIGHPQFHLRDQAIALKPLVGFGGRVALTTRPFRLRDWFCP